ncbi:hypothetical protein H0H81_009713 [Sphagnurus paluster]|uniref:ubiquitinyl hydrolase 1 n=1 Tax=Sphagnurus paluster TaxID=117069 RepID=A0A9P7GV05_9AGAR|nr:hypothetical protein H0H81_009713 [Sphagnurus paluster]
MSLTHEPPPPPLSSGHGSIDLVGGPFAVIESDPGKKDAHRPGDFDDPTAERVWFANQLSDDACASHAILNVLLNCPEVDIGEELRIFRGETEHMSPVVRGLTKPADIRGALNVLAITTLDEAKVAAKAKAKATPTKRGTKPPPTKRAKTSDSPTKQGKAKADAESESSPEEAYHFIGYVPAHGKVWELDGLKSGPLEVGELPTDTPPGAWMDVVRPALRMKMEKYGGAAEGGNNIRFSLLAIVDGAYEKASDALQLLKRERIALERRMGVGWEAKVDQSMLETAQHAFSACSGDRTYAADFGARRIVRDVEILNMPEAALAGAWETCVRNAVRANVAVEDEFAKAARANADHMRRTFDYEPFLTTFVERLQAEGLLNTLLGLDENGMKIRKKR